MKRIISLTISICFMFSLFVSNTAFASAEEEVYEWQDISLSEEEFNEILSQNPNNDTRPYATGLINGYYIGVSKDGNTLIVAGKTIGTTGVIKCGFSKVTIQRRKTGSTEWSDYIPYTDLYNDFNLYNLSKSCLVTPGFQFRVVCTHYAKKNILSVEKIDNVSNIVTF